MSEISFELSSLAKAVGYQEWIFQSVQPFLGKRILELGAGIGNMSRWLPVRERLILSEGDASLLDHLRTNLKDRVTDPRVDSRVLSFSADGISESDRLALESENIDTVVSFNVLEHIENDRSALAALAAILQKSKAKGPRRLISFVPAHAWAYGGLDRAFGHYRRYSKAGFEKMLREIAPGAKLKSRYFNSVGLAGWVLTGRILGRSEIGDGAVQTFEILCPWIKPVDEFLQTKLKFPAGQSLLSIAEWEPHP